MVYYIMNRNLRLLGIGNNTINGIMKYVELNL